MPRPSSHLLFLCIALTLSLFPLRVQAALPKELPASPAKFLTGACLTRSEDLWITAEAGDIGNVPNRRLRRFGNSRRSFAADVCFRGENVRSNHGEIIHPLDRSSSPPSCHGRQGAEPTGLASYHASTRNSCNWSSQLFEIVFLTRLMHRFSGIVPLMTRSISGGARCARRRMRLT